MEQRVIPRPQPPRIAPWRDRRGDFSPLKALVFAGLFLPALWIGWLWASGSLGPRTLIEINHQVGLWAIRFLVITLAITPLRQIWRWNDLVFVRRMIGLAAFAYALAHLVAYWGDQGWSIGTVAAEIAKRFYLTLGFAVLVLLVPLAVTSTNGMMRRLGGLRWRRLHQLIYPLALIGALHFFLQSKIGVTEPIVMIAATTWLLLWRVMAWRIGPERAGTLPAVLLLTVFVTAATACGEAFYYHFKIGVPLMRVLSANWVWAAGIRPAWIIGGLGVAVVVVATARRLLPEKPRARMRLRETAG